MITAANMDGDSDSVACIAGAISGAFNGVDALPNDWLKTIEDGDGLLYIAKELWACVARDKQGLE